MTQADPLQAEVADLHSRLRILRQDIEAIAGASLLIRAGFSEDGDWTSEDQIRATALESLSGITERFAIQIAEVKALHKTALDAHIANSRQKHQSEDA